MSDVLIHIESTTHEKLLELEAELPSDVHLVRYKTFLEEEAEGQRDSCIHDG